MNTSRIGLLLFLLMGMTLQLSAQAFQLFNTRKYEPRNNYSDPVSIVYKGKILAQPGSLDRPFFVGSGMTGKISVSTIDRSEKGARPIAPIGFNVAIHHAQTNSLWMYSEEPLFEVEIARLLKECDQGDTLIFMPVDRNYRLSRHKIMVMNGC